MPRRRRTTEENAAARVIMGGAFLLAAIFLVANLYPIEYLSVAVIVVVVVVISLVLKMVSEEQQIEPELYSELNRIQAQHLAWNTARLGALNPYEFERVVTTLYDGMGYQARHTGRAGDNGVDILVYDKHGDKHVVQCKHKTVGNVGAGAIRDLIGTIAREKAVTGVLCTNADYTQPARDTASGHPVLLYNGEDIVRQLNLIEQKNKMTNGAPETRRSLNFVPMKSNQRE